MPSHQDTKQNRDSAIEKLERVYRTRVDDICEKLYNSIYSARFNASAGVSPDVLEAIMDHTIGQELAVALDSHKFHPLFMADRNGMFVWLNQTAKHVFADFELTRGGSVLDFYNDGVVFDAYQVRTTATRVLRSAIGARRSVDPSNVAWTKGNELVFFYHHHRKLIRLIEPVTACLYISTLHHSQASNEIIGTLGKMAVPLYLRHAQPEGRRRDVFVSMPFTPNWPPSVYDAIERAIVCADYNPIRVDQERTDNIQAKIRERIQGASFVIADVTGANPNVMLEVGFALGLHKAVILITQDEPRQSPFNVMNATQERYDRGDTDGLCCRLFERIKGL